MTEEEKEIKRIAKALRKRRLENPQFRYFLASKRGGNARGVGENRSVILSTSDGKEWGQFYKIWGNNNEERARKIIEMANKPDNSTL